MLTLEQIPMRSDNYSYALIKDQAVVMIDPSEPHESRAYFAERPHLKLVAIFNTHSHLDHVAGNVVLNADWRAPVYGPIAEQERIPALTHAVANNDSIELLGIKITAHDVRAHTIGHTAYLVHAPIDKVIKHSHNHAPYVADNLRHHRALFVGDSLFGAGCGRLFEGTREQLRDCLTFYKNQPHDVLMACAHEYTKANLAFARAMFPDDAEIEHRLSTIDRLIADEGSTVPCLFDLEQKTNPFLLALVSPYRELLAQRFGVDATDDAAIVGALRAAKDAF